MPYNFKGQWVFDDADKNLKREAFVGNSDTIIERMAQNIPDAENGFLLLFSAKPFPGMQDCLEWRKAESEGNWYHSSRVNADGWLCASLLKYFDSVPEKIYVQFKARTIE